MTDLKTNYLGLELRNPIIAGSSGLTNSVTDIINLEKSGAAAVVLKSLFEEEIIMELQDTYREMNTPGTLYPEIYDMFDYDSVEDSVTKYLFLIEESKKTVKIPIIASVNCVSSEEWPQFTRRIQDAGADALELNVFVMPSDFSKSAEDNEKIYFDVIDKVKSEASIPISVKISYYFSNLGQMVQKLSQTGIQGIVLFNRFYSPDFNLDNFNVMSTNVLSTPGELSTSLRWIAIMSDRVNCDLCASTGIHDGRSVVKEILAGAKSVQVASTLYRHGFGRIRQMLDEMEEWMKLKDYKALDDFRGRMSQKQSSNPAAYERVQFMKYFSGK